MGSKDLERKRDCCYPPPADLDRDQDQQDKKDVNRDREDASLFSSLSSSPCRVPHGQACGMPGPCLGSTQELTLEKVRVEEKGRMLGVSATPEREARGITYSDSRPGWSSSPQTKKSDHRNLRGPRDSLTWRTFPPSSRVMACRHPLFVCGGEGATWEQAQWPGVNGNLGGGEGTTHKDMGQGGLASCLQGLGA